MSTRIALGAGAEAVGGIEKLFVAGIAAAQQQAAENDARRAAMIRQHTAQMRQDTDDRLIAAVTSLAAQRDQALAELAQVRAALRTERESGELLLLQVRNLKQQLTKFRH